MSGKEKEDLVGVGPVGDPDLACQGPWGLSSRAWPVPGRAKVKDD